jgi:oligopeptide/dipeptide ABC transporter ATP-binding protein
MVPALGVAHAACRFADRCDRAQPVCHTDAPLLRELGPGHLARCHFPVEDRAAAEERA